MLQGERIPFQSYCWSLGTTSYRTERFNLNIERQLGLLESFRARPENRDRGWDAALQARYYRYLHAEGFLTGDAARPDKDARQKTSGLVALGLVDADRRLTGAGEALLEVSRAGCFEPQGKLWLPPDSEIYLEQLLKTSCRVGSHVVRPFLVLIRLLTRFGALSEEEFAYLLPLCIDPESTAFVIGAIEALRAGRAALDDLLAEAVLGSASYRRARARFLEAGEVDGELVVDIGLNRKSRQYDRAYFPLFEALRACRAQPCADNARSLYARCMALHGRPGALWRRALFATASRAAILKDPLENLRPSPLLDAPDERAFRERFFRMLHLNKIKATLGDYLDLNRRYLTATDTVIFEDGAVRFDTIPKHFFADVESALFAEAFTPAKDLQAHSPLSEISPALRFREEAVLAGARREFGRVFHDLGEVVRALGEDRRRRFDRLIDRRFDDGTLLKLLSCFERRDDREISRLVTDNADVPTIFEYVVGIVWYKLSERQGDILRYMKLSLQADLLPKTHAGGGGADLVYEYPASPDYPAHHLLLEMTLADGANQRRMEMEPVSRHLGEERLRAPNEHTYCIFASPHLDRNVVSDFRNRRTYEYFNEDFTRSVRGLKILPVKTGELARMLRGRWTYRRLYRLFEAAYRSAEPVPVWYQRCIVGPLGG